MQAHQQPHNLPSCMTLLIRVKNYASKDSLNMCMSVYAAKNADWTIHELLHYKLCNYNPLKYLNSLAKHTKTT